MKKFLYIYYAVIKNEIIYLICVSLGKNFKLNLIKLILIIKIFF